MIWSIVELMRDETEVTAVTSWVCAAMTFAGSLDPNALLAFVISPPYLEI